MLVAPLTESEQFILEDFSKEDVLNLERDLAYISKPDFRLSEPPESPDVQDNFYMSRFFRIYQSGMDSAATSISIVLFTKEDPRYEARDALFMTLNAMNALRKPKPALIPELAQVIGKYGFKPVDDIS